MNSAASRMIEVGQTIGNYKITAKIGEGGMGVVYLAEHPVIGRKVALKAIHPELSRNPEMTSRFKTEAKSVNQIGNEHIVDISDFGNTPEGEFYFIMEYLQGEALADRLRREKLFAPPRAVQIAAQVADALGAAHVHGIIHRDLKPENIFLIQRGQNPDFVKVLDFGLAKLTQGDEKVTHKTRTGSVMGTPYYMAPEQCEGKADIDHRSDLYAVGVILYEMLTGKVPFGGEGYGEIIVKHITQPVPPLRSLNPNLSPALEAVVMKSLAKSRDERFATMEEFRAAMLDPETFLRTGSAPVPALGAVPGSYADGTSSGMMTAAGAPATPMPMPSTFREGAGELLDEDLLGQKQSKKNLYLGVGGAALAAAVLAVIFTRGGEKPADAPPAPAPTAAVAPPVTPPAPVVPDRVTIKFSSEPPGAEVVRKDTGKVLGTTPFEFKLEYGKVPIEFAFTKKGFRELVVKQAPTENIKVPALLVPDEEPQVAAAKPAVTDRPTKPAAVKPAAAKPPKRRPGDKPRGVFDEDGVLEPSF